MSHRLFVAVQPVPHAVEALEQQLREPRRALAEAPMRWNPVPQWHVTLLFTPTVDQHALPALTEGLDRLAGGQQRFQLAVAGGGAFPTLERAHHLIALLDDPACALPALAAGCRSLADGLGLAHSDEPYQPHLTLARTNRARDHSSDAGWLRALATAPWPVEELVLVRSVLGIRGHAEHTVLHRSRLG